MSYPAGIVTRPIVAGDALAVTDGKPLIIKTTTVASRALIHVATGTRLERVTNAEASPYKGESLYWQTAVTDRDSEYLDANTRELIILGPDEHTHTYTTTLTVWDDLKKVGEYVIGPYAVPTPAEPSQVMDLDRLQVVDVTTGTAIPIPESWTQIVDAAASAGEAATEAVAAIAPALDDIAAVKAETTSGRLSEAELAGRFIVNRVWNGTAYPTRVPGAVNVFIGPYDPGLAMADDDIWANPDAATIGDVLDAIYANRAVTSVFIGAADLAVIGNDTAAEATGRAGILEQYGSTTGGDLSAPTRVLVDGGSTRLGTVIRVPAGGELLQFKVFWLHKQNALTGGVRFQVTANPLSDGTDLGTATGFDQSITFGAGAHLTVKVSTIGVYTLPGETTLRVSVARNGAHSEDSFAGEVGLLGVQVVRV